MSGWKEKVRSSLSLFLSLDDWKTDLKDPDLF